MNNNYNISRKYKNTALNGFYPVFHSPLIFDMNTQTTYRKAGYVAWPQRSMTMSHQTAKDEERRKNISDKRPYFAYPKNKA